MTDTTRKVAVVGTGRMGAAMARRLAGAGHRLTLWNRTASVAGKLAEEIGAESVPTAAKAVAAADMTITSLADDRAVRSVYTSPEGVLDGVSDGSLVVDTSTISVDTVREMGGAVDRAGGRFLDCPVSGSVSTVEAGSLVVMAGGDPGALSEVEPVLSAIAKEVVHVGPRGSGAGTKLAVNGLLHAINVALSEALVLAERAGVERATAYHVFSSGAAGAPFLHYKKDAYLAPAGTPVAFSLDLVAKDLELITDLADQVDSPMRQANTDLEVVQSAIAAGFGNHDMSALASFLRGESP